MVRRQFRRRHRRLPCLPAKTYRICRRSIPPTARVGSGLHEQARHHRPRHVRQHRILTVGSLKEEDSACALNDLQRALTKQHIGQLWEHHTGHDATRGYGPKMRTWHLDTDMVGERLDKPDADVAFTLKFPKCRRRTPQNRGDFEQVDLVLAHGLWTS